jgi:hypothetical protein
MALGHIDRRDPAGDFDFGTVEQIRAASGQVGPFQVHREKTDISRIPGGCEAMIAPAGAFDNVNRAPRAQHVNRRPTLTPTPIRR